jgi:peptidoglycan-associated lipoprotein
MHSRIRPFVLLSVFPLVACAHAQLAKASSSQPTSSPPAVAANASAGTAAPASERRDAPAARCEGDLNRVLSQQVLRFDFDQDVLTPSGEKHLQQLADEMVRCPGARIIISGNCDERGTEEYNLALGQRRAEVAKHYLAVMGVMPSHVETVSYGFEHPVDLRHSEEAWAMNRRDDFSISNDQR